MSEEVNEDIPIDESSEENDAIDALISIIIIAAAGVFFYQSRTFAGRSLGDTDPGAAFWPRIVLGLIIFFGTLNLVVIFRRNRGELDSLLPTAAGLRDAIPSRGEVDQGTKRYAVVLVLTVLYLQTLSDIGFLVGTTLFLMAFLWNMGYRSIPKVAVFGVAISLFAFLLFRNMMNLGLPFGRGPFRGLGIFVENLL